MEIVLAIVVVAAVIFFGALISAGNERQRRAIDGLREQASLWAEQDLRLKRAGLARDVSVDDPLAWFNRIARKACGHALDLRVVEAFDEPRALYCVSGDGSRQVLFTPLTPREIRLGKRQKRSRLSTSAHQNPLTHLPGRTESYELSVLNGGILFDLELPVAWQALTGQRVDTMERLWVYITG